MADLTHVEKAELEDRLKDALKSSNYIRTNNNAPIEDGATYFLCPSEYENLLKTLRKNPDYFKDRNIVDIQVISDAEYNRMIRKKFVIDEMSYDFMRKHLPTGHEIAAEIEKQKQIYYDHVDNELVTPKDAMKKLEQPKGIITIH